MSQFVFRVSSVIDKIGAGGKKKGDQANGTLVLNGKSYSAVSGPHGNGALCFGRFEVGEERKNRKDKPGSTIGDIEFFIPIIPKNPSCKRDSLGIHPDGGQYFGTLGCIGLQGDDAKGFWGDWTGLSSKPTELIVVAVC